jgi:AbrB family looped-hinge helix DNA binding protein
MIGLSVNAGALAQWPSRGYSYVFYIDISLVRVMPATATLSSKFQISIPKAVREAHRWEAGQEFAFIPKAGGVLLVPVPELDDLMGIAPEADGTGYRDRDDRI